MVEQSLANMRETHQKVLAMAAALKGEIERLSYPLSQRQLAVSDKIEKQRLPDIWVHRMQEEAASSTI